MRANPNLRYLRKTRKNPEDQQETILESLNTSHKNISRKELERVFKKVLQDEIFEKMHDFILDLPKQAEIIEEVKRVVETPEYIDIDHEAVFRNRLIEGTCHPTNIISRDLKKAIWEKARLLREQYKKDSNELIISAINLAQEISQELTEAYYKNELDLQKAYIPCLERTTPESSQATKDKIRSYDYESITDMTVSAESSNDKKFREDTLNQIERERLAFLDELKKSVKLLKGKECKIDEAEEIAHDAKFFLLNNLANIYTHWIDFDGAKRPERTMFTTYGALVIEDIRKGRNAIERSEYIEAKNTFKEFVKTDVIIHEYTEILKNNGLDPYKTQEMEEMLNLAKKEHRKQLKKLVKIRNLTEQRRKEQGKKGMIFLSQQIRLNPRLDHKHIEALKSYYKNPSTFATNPHCAKYQNDFKTAKNILLQILEVNYISQNSSYSEERELENPKGFVSIVNQIMIANCESAEDIKIIETTLKDTENDVSLQAFFHEEEEKDATSNIGITGLFEDADTVGKEFAYNALMEIYNHFGKNNIGIAKLKKRIKEFFYAGSDLSKKEGQMSAIIGTKEAFFGIMDFIKTTELEDEFEVDLKLGTGEAVLRQLGYFDQKAYKSLIADNILEYDPEIEKNSEIEVKIKFLEEKFGANWREKLIRQPSGYHFVLQRYPWINSFTLQSCTRESLMCMTPSKLKKAFSELENIHQNNKELYIQARKDLNKYERRLKALEEIKRGMDQLSENDIKKLSNGAKEKLKKDLIELDKLRSSEKIREIAELKKFLENEDNQGFLERAAEIEKSVYQYFIGLHNESKEKPNGGLKNIAAMVELLAQAKRPKLRQRGTSRASGEKTSLYKAAEKLKRGGIDARAIATNSSSALVYMLGLMGKGAMLEEARKNKSLEKVLFYLPAQDILREIKCYETIAPSVFAELEKMEGMEEIVATLKAEWITLISFKEYLREELLIYQNPLKSSQEYVGKDLWTHYDNITNVSMDEFSKKDKKMLISCFADDMRELMTDDFASDKTKMFYMAYKLIGQQITRNKAEIANTTSDILNLAKEIKNDIKADISIEELIEKLSENNILAEGVFNRITMPQRKKLVALLKFRNDLFQQAESQADDYGILTKINGIALGRMG